jgi:nicotinate dehydrogenase subunit B
MKKQVISFEIDEKKLPAGMSRRRFLKHLGGGLTVALTIGGFSTLHSCVEGDEAEYNAFIRIGEDGRVDCLTGKIEMGQSVYTSLKQLLAEELDVAMEKVDIVLGDTEICPYDAGTWGSLSIRRFGPELRAGAAEGRATLLGLASKSLNVPMDQLMASDGVVSVKNDTKRQISYVDLLKGKQFIKKVSGEVKVKSPSEFKVIGHSIHRHDAEAKVKGEAIYAADIRLPGMLYARILRPSDHRATLKSVSVDPAKEIEGVEVINQDGIVAVLHKDPELATLALSKVEAEWVYPKSSVNSESIFDHLLNTGTKSAIVEEEGSSAIAEDDGLVVIEKTYTDGYKAHAPIEPHVATALMDGDKLVMWASSQTPFGSRRDIAKELDMPEEKVHLKPIFLGGGFGGKIYNPQVIELAKLVKLTGKPIQLAYTRREEFFYDYFRPAAVVKAKAATDKSGIIRHWNYEVYYAGKRGSQFFYETNNKLIRSWGDGEGEHGHLFKTGAWRAPGNNTNTFVRESQIDAMASEIGMDPLEFRLKNLKNEKMIRTLKLAAEKFGWTPIKAPSGRGWGISCGFDAGAWVATIAEVDVDTSTGSVQPKRIVCAHDMGLVVNPHGATIQVEGGITMGLGYALSEDIVFDGGVIKSRNFDDYKIATFSVTPAIESYFIDDPESAPQGGGEPAIITVGGAIANAIYDSVGVRMTRLPMTKERILEALREV